MAWEDARDFLAHELDTNVKLPIEYGLEYKSGPRQGQVYKIIILTPARVATLTTIRKRALMDDRGEETISFAPASGCPCCGR